MEVKPLILPTDRVPHNQKKCVLALVKRKPPRCSAWMRRTDKMPESEPDMTRGQA